MMPQRRFLVFPVVLLLLVAAQAGCRGRTTAPAAPIGSTVPVAARAVEPQLSDPTQAGALAALSAYAEARRSLDSPAAYALLTPSARSAFTSGEFAQLYIGQRLYSYTGVEVGAPKAGVVRGHVIGLVVGGTKTFRYARFPYTLRFEAGKWGLAQGGPLGRQALRAFEAGRWDDNLTIVDRWLALDPFAWEAYLERFYVFKDTGQPERALEAWNEALKLAPPEEHPELLDILAMLYSLTRQGDLLQKAAASALERADSLGPDHTERYDSVWRAGVIIDLAFAERYRGNDREALQYFQEARALDPKNIDVERFLRTMPSR